MEVYLAEDIVIPNLAYNDNQDILDVIIKKPKGLIPMLDEEGQVPRGTWEGFLNKFTRQYTGHKRVKHRSGSKVFTLCHYAGEVTYDPSLFILKNKDTLSADLVEAMAGTTDAKMAEIFAEQGPASEIESSSPAGPRRVSSMGLPGSPAAFSSNKVTVGTNFRIQLESLMVTLNDTEPRYIRCIKPNSVKKPGIFESQLTNEQLTYSGVFEAVVIMQSGYPFRLSHVEFRTRYHMLVLGDTSRKAIFQSGSCNRNDLQVMVTQLSVKSEPLACCHVGKTMVFYRAEQHRILERERKYIIDAAIALTQRCTRGFVARFLYQMILRTRDACHEAIFSRDVHAMRAISEQLQQYLQRYHRVFGVVFSLECIDISRDYSSTIVAEKEVLSEISDLMAPTHDIFDVFDSLSAAVTAAKHLQYSATLNGKTISLRCRDNSLYYTAHGKVKQYAAIIDVKKHLEIGIRNHDEIMLQSYMSKLEAHKVSGLVDHSFCASEVKQAQAIVETAAEAFHKFLQLAEVAMSTGHLTYTLNESGLHYELSSDALQSFVQSWDTDKGKQRNAAKESKQTQNMIVVCRAMLAMRQCAENNEWENVWSLLPQWNGYFTPIAPSASLQNLSPSDSDDDSDAETAESIERDSSLVPVIPAVADKIIEEVHGFYVCSMQLHYFANLSKKLQTVHVSSTLQLTPIHIDISAIQFILEYLENYVDRMHQLQRETFAATKVRFRLVEATAQANHDMLNQTLRNVYPLSMDDADVILAKKWNAFLSCIHDMELALTEDGLPAAPEGFVELVLLDNERLLNVIEMSQSFEFQHSDASIWKSVISYLIDLEKIRSELSENNLKQALICIEDHKKRVSTTVPPRLPPRSVFHEFNPIAVVTEEINRCRREIRHQLALTALVDEISLGAIKGEVGDIAIDTVNVIRLQELLASSSADLIHTPEVVQLSQDIDMILTIRSCVVAGEWDYVSRLCHDAYDMSEGFESSHPRLKSEFQLVYDESIDLQARKKLQETIQRPVFYKGSEEYVGELFPVSNWADENADMEDALAFCLSRDKLSFEAVMIANSAKLLLQLRRAATDNRWEDIPWCSNDVSTSGLGTHVLEQCKEIDENKMTMIINKLLSDARKYTCSLSIESLSTEKSYCVEDLLRLMTSAPLHEDAFPELQVLKQCVIERKCRLLLVVASQLGCISGTVDVLRSEKVSVEHLLGAIEYVKLQRRHTSALVHEWLDAAIALANLRLAVGNASSEGVDLMSYIDVKSLQAVINQQHAPVFALKEISLVMDHVSDLSSVAELVDALHLGRPQYFNGKFDTKHVEYSHLLSALEVAKKLQIRSDRLDRLMFYAELCMMLRKALMNHQWDLSESGERTRTEQTRGISVKQCLLDYQQAGKFFQRVIVGIPPKTLKDEFQLTSREWDRRLILQGFPLAFDSGRIGGTNGALMLQEAKYQRLVDQVERVAAWEKQTNIQDPDLQILVAAANEMIAVRKCAVEVSTKYHRPMTFAKSTSSLKEVLYGSTFITDAIDSAIDMVSSLLVTPYPMNEEWAAMDRVVAKIEVSSRLRSTRMQVEILAAETFERFFNSNVLQVFHSFSSSGAPPMQRRGEILSNLQTFCLSYKSRGVALAKQGLAGVKPSSISEMLYVSAVIFIHLTLAETKNNYEEFQRNWLDIPVTAVNYNFLVPPITSLEQNLQSSCYFVQCILRTAVSLKLHPVVMQQLERITRHVEDEITLKELTLALREGQVTGAVGNVRHERISSIALQTALDRAKDIALSDNTIGVITSRSSLVVPSEDSDDEDDIADLPVIKRCSLLERRSSGRYRYSGRLSASEVALMELTAGLQEGAVKGGVGRVRYSQVQQAPLESVLTKAAVLSAQRPDVLQLRHSCELISELRNALAFRNYQLAFDILNDNIGEEGQSFKELLHTLYSANFSIHPNAVDEFCLIALETCESYWKIMARRALLTGAVAGVRSNLAYCNIAWSHIDDVLDLADGIVEISKDSIILRELCIMVKHMRSFVMRGHEVTINSEPLPEVDSIRPRAIIAQSGIIEAGIENALERVLQLSPAPLLPSQYAHFITLQGIATQVLDCIEVVEGDILIPKHRDALLKECQIVLDYTRLYAGVIALEKALSIKCIWLSFAASRIDVDPCVKKMIEEAVTATVALDISADAPAEKRYKALVDMGCYLYDIISALESDAMCISAINFSEIVLPLFSRMLQELPNASFPQALLKHCDLISDFIKDYNIYALCCDFIEKKENFCVSFTNGETASCLIIDEENATFAALETAKPLTAATYAKLKLCHQLHEMRVAFHRLHNSRALLCARNLRANGYITEEVEWVTRHCEVMRAKRALECGILSCIVPPVPGWSNFSQAFSLSLMINDYNMHAALRDTRGCSYDVTSLQTLVRIASTITQLIAALRRRILSSGNDDVDYGTLQSMFYSLIPANIPLDAQHTTFNNIVQCEVSVRDMLVELRGIMDNSSGTLISHVTKFVEKMLELVDAEQRIFELNGVCVAALTEFRVTGSPGALECPLDAVNALRDALNVLDTEPLLLAKSIALQRAHQTMKLLLPLRECVSDQNWQSLDSLLGIWRFMMTQDSNNDEVPCFDIIYTESLDSMVLIDKDDSFLESMLATFTCACDNFFTIPNRSSLGRRNVGDEKVRRAINDVLSCDIAEVLRVLPCIHDEMTLIDGHFNFERFCRMFVDALHSAPATGDPGHMVVDCIEYNALFAVRELVGTSGLLLYDSAAALHRLCVAICDIRQGQKSHNLDQVRTAIGEARTAFLDMKGDIGENRIWEQVLQCKDEVEIAALDLEQQQWSQALREALLSDAVPPTEVVFDVALQENGMTILEEYTTSSVLTAVVHECETMTTERSQGLVQLLSTAKFAARVRDLCLSKNWDELEVALESVFGSVECPYSDVVLDELERAKQLMILHRSMSVARQAISSNRLVGEQGDINMNDIIISELEVALELLKSIREDWITIDVRILMTSCEALFTLRTHILKKDWRLVLECATSIIERSKLVDVFGLAPIAQEEVSLAHDHAAFEVSRTALLNGLANGRLDGDVGEIDTSKMSADILKHALAISEYYAVDHKEIQILEASARVVFDLRQAQLLEKWIDDTKYEDCTIDAVDIPLNMSLSMAERKIYAKREKTYEESIPEYTRYLIRADGIDQDLVNTKDTEFALAAPCVAEVLEGATYVKQELGLADISAPELAFAHEELVYRQLCQRLLTVLTKRGYTGMPGALDPSRADSNRLEKVLRYCDEHDDISERGDCKWLVRDAKLLFVARKSRENKDFETLNEVFVEAKKENQILAKGHHPILLPVWNELRLLYADMHFYMLLSDFAQEMKVTYDRYCGRDRAKAITTLTSLMSIITRTKVAAEMWPCREFDRLLEAEQAALELRTHRCFDGSTSPKDIIMKVLDIKDRDKKYNFTSYILLLMPDISQMTDMLDTEQLIESLEAAIVQDQKYFRCPLGHIDTNEIDLETLSKAIQAAMPLFNTTGTPENLNLLHMCQSMMEVRTAVVGRQWSKVNDLIEEHEDLFSGYSKLVGEELLRLRLEAENDKALLNLKASLSQGRLTNVIDLVKKLSKHRTASMSVADVSTRQLSLFDRFRTDSAADIKAHLVTLDTAIDKAMAIKHRSDTLGEMLRAAVLIRALRSAISSGNWEDVQQLTSDESNYTRLPPGPADEIRAAKSALHYRNCMATLSNGLISGCATGTPGNMNYSVVDCTDLQSAISQAEVLDVADPATALMLEISHRVCDLRRAVLRAQWFPPCETKLLQYARELTPPSIPSVAATTSIPFQASTEQDDRTDSDAGSDSQTSDAPSSESSLRIDDLSVEEQLREFKDRVFIFKQVRAILHGRRRDSSSEYDGKQDDSSDDEADLGLDERSKHAFDWIDYQLKALKSVTDEINRLDMDLRERRRQTYVISALELLPVPVQQFSGNAGHQLISPRDDDPYSVDTLRDAIDAAKAIPGEVPEATMKLYSTADLILQFRKALNAMDLDQFQALLEKEKRMSRSGQLSPNYGVYEMKIYKSATLAASLAQNTLIKCMQQGCVSGLLRHLKWDSIDTIELENAVLHCASLLQSAYSLSLGMEDILREASLLLSLRIAVRNRDWRKIRTIFEANNNVMLKLSHAVDEIVHIQNAVRYHELTVALNGTLTEPLPEKKEEQYSFVAVKLPALEHALNQSDRLMMYLKQHYSQSELDNDPYSHLHVAATQVLQLWKAVESKQWGEEYVAAGVVHSLPVPNDPLLEMLFASIRQHEVAQRLSYVHKQLSVLQIDASKHFKNIRQSVRASVSLMAGEFATISPIIEPVVTTPPVPSRSAPKRSSLSQNASSPHRRSSTASPTVATIAHQSKRSSLTPPRRQAPTRQSLTILKPVTNRRNSLGSIAINTNRRSSFVSQSTGNEQATKDLPDATVAHVLCSIDWLMLSALAQNHFESARNVLVSRILSLRLNWGCLEGGPEEDNVTGNVSLARLDTELLHVALSDVRRAKYFYSQKLSSNIIEQSNELTEQIKNAQAILSCRHYAMQNQVDSLIYELRRCNFLSKHITVSRMRIHSIEMMKEFELFERFAVEYLADKTLRKLVEYLSSVVFVNAMCANNDAVVEMKSFINSTQSSGRMTKRCADALNVGSHLCQMLVASIMSNNSRVLQCVKDIMAVVESPSSQIRDMRDKLNAIGDVFLAHSLYDEYVMNHEVIDDDASTHVEKKTTAKQLRSSITSIFGAFNNADNADHEPKGISETEKYWIEMLPQNLCTLREYSDGIVPLQLIQAIADGSFNDAALSEPLNIDPLWMLCGRIIAACISDDESSLEAMGQCRVPASVLRFASNADSSRGVNVSDFTSLLVTVVLQFQTTERAIHQRATTAPHFGVNDLYSLITRFMELVKHRTDKYSRTHAVVSRIVVHVKEKTAVPKPEPIKSSLSKNFSRQRSTASNWSRR